MHNSSFVIVQQPILVSYHTLFSDIDGKPKQFIGVFPCKQAVRRECCDMCQFGWPLKLRLLIEVEYLDGHEKEVLAFPALTTGNSLLKMMKEDMKVFKIQPSKYAYGSAEIVPKITNSAYPYSKFEYNSTKYIEYLNEKLNKLEWKFSYNFIRNKLPEGVLDFKAKEPSLTNLPEPILNVLGIKTFNSSKFNFKPVERFDFEYLINEYDWNQVFEDRISYNYYENNKFFNKNNEYFCSECTTDYRFINSHEQVKDQKIPYILTETVSRKLSHLNFTNISNYSNYWNYWNYKPGFGNSFPEVLNRIVLRSNTCSKELKLIINSNFNQQSNQIIP